MFEGRLPIVKTTQEADYALEQIETSPILAWDFETFGLNPLSDAIRGVGFGISPNEAYYFGQKFMRDGEVLERLKGILTSEIERGGANLKFDAKVAYVQWGIFSRIDFDVILEIHLLNDCRNPIRSAVGQRPYSLWAQAGQYLLDAERRDEVEAWDPSVPDDLVAVHCLNDCLSSFRLHQLYLPELRRDKLLDYYRGYLLKAYQHFVKMELVGLPIDADRLPQVLDDIEAMVEEKSRALREFPEVKKVEKDNKAANPKKPDKWPINVNSYKQVGAMMFEHGGLEPKSYSKAGNAETGKAILEQFAKEGYEPASHIIEIRHLRKLRDGYLIPWINSLDDDGRLRFNYMFHGTDTGRLASGFHIFMHDEVLESLVVAPPDKLLVHADYGQMEMRFGAFASGEERWIEAFREGLDIYKVVAADFLSKEYDEVTKEERDRAKTSALALMYGVQPPRLAAIWGADISEAVFFQQQFFRKYQKAAAWRPWIEDTLRKRGYVATPFGRRRRFFTPGLGEFQSFHMTKAVNSPIQGGASDLCIERGIAVTEEMEHLGVRDLGYVHDSVDFEIPRKGWKPVCRRIVEILEEVPGFDFPFAVDIFVGPAWNKMVDVKEKLGI